MVATVHRRSGSGRIRLPGAFAGGELAVAVLGVGLDVVDVEAFAAQLADPASGFVAATYRPAERRVAGQVADVDQRARHLAGRFAAKEALVKAWSMARRGHPPALAQVDLCDIEVVDDGFGRPALRLHGLVAAAVVDLAIPPVDAAGPAVNGPPSDTAVTAHLSISHDGPVAAAVVILEDRAMARR